MDFGANLYKELLNKKKISYGQLRRAFAEAEKRGEHLVGYITFMDDFPEPRAADERTFVVSSDNDGYKPSGGFTIFGSSIDGRTENIRLDRIMANEAGGINGLRIEACYLSI